MTSPATVAPPRHSKTRANPHSACSLPGLRPRRGRPRMERRELAALSVRRPGLFYKPRASRGPPRTLQDASRVPSRPSPPGKSDRRRLAHAPRWWLASCTLRSGASNEAGVGGLPRGWGGSWRRPCVCSPSRSAGDGSASAPIASTSTRGGRRCLRPSTPDSDSTSPAEESHHRSSPPETSASPSPSTFPGHPSCASGWSPAPRPPSRSRSSSGALGGLSVVERCPRPPTSPCR